MLPPLQASEPKAKPGTLLLGTYFGLWYVRLLAAVARVCCRAHCGYT